MKTIRQLSNRKLDQLQARLMGKIWNGSALVRHLNMVAELAKERQRRLLGELP